jgi:phenylalanine-4-hydroxylase
VLFEPAWGTYDMAVGAHVHSVFAGAADKAQFYGHIYAPSDMDLPVHALDEREQRLNALYAEIRALREGATTPEELERRVDRIAAALDAEFPEDWLARLELVELLKTRQAAPALRVRLREQLEALKTDEAHRILIDNGLALLV